MSLSAGKILYHLWYAPRRLFLQSKHRGMFSQLGDTLARFQMEASVRNLKPQKYGQFESKVKICFLTGRKYWYQTIYCAFSLQQSISAQIPFQIFDDGSLTKFQCAELKRLLPTAEIIEFQEIEALLDRYLPRDKFPSLRQRRLVYPHISKLIDVHVGSSGWKLVLDSDMLFFEKPVELLDWLRNPAQAIHLIDTESHYGYSLKLMQELAGAAIPEKINVGVTGLLSENLNWQELEKWCEALLEREGSHYLQEQALIAMLMAKTQALALPAARYRVQPTEEEVQQAQSALQHYVAESKPWYFRYGWKKIPGTGNQERAAS